MQLNWSLRSQPLEVEGCWAEGLSLAQLQKKLMSDPRRKALRAVQTGPLLVLLGADIPWVENLIYLGRRDLIYLPTLWEPDVPYEWLLAKLKALGHPPWALIPPGRALGLSAATALA